VPLVDLADPAFLIALVVGVLLFLLAMKLRTPAPEPLRCADCNRRMDLEEEIVDYDNPERSFVPGERRGWFRCPQCRRRVRARY
jgi:hypothetical protein